MGEVVSNYNPRRSDACPFCNQRETQVHIFSECQWSSRIWRKTDVASMFSARGPDSCQKWCSKVMEMGDQGKIEEWCVLLWYLWKERNTHLFNGAKLPEEEIPIRAKYLLAEYKQHQASDDNTTVQMERKPWRKPPIGCIFVCTNAGILDGEGSWVWSDCKFLLAAAKRVRGSWSAEVAEALAADV
ncbi:unnamed protein product [Linum trigynum]|uniref:Reverse transcriptase zinc-binding domain-containing protein n=1 Tax=Linum trigynum TaxID=586398 RepID=A0AAV2GF66_9ROSI